METEETLLDDIYGSIVVRGDYAAILNRLSALFGSHAGSVLERDGDVLQFRAVSNLDPSIMDVYNSCYCASDPWLLAEGDRPPGVATIGSRLVDPECVARTGFYNDILKPHDIWDILNVKFGSAPQPVLYFTFYHPHREVFRTEDASVFEAVGRHIARAHRLRSMLARADPSVGASPSIGALCLTPKEREIAALMLDGLSYAAIAEAARVTRNTAHWHARNIFAKASVGSKAAFIARFAHAVAFRRPSE